MILSWARFAAALVSVIGSLTQWWRERKFIEIGRRLEREKSSQALLDSVRRANEEKRDLGDSMSDTAKRVRNLYRDSP